MPVARALERVDPWGYGVATLEEGTRCAPWDHPADVVFTPMLARTLPAAACASTAPELERATVDRGLGSGDAATRPGTS